MKMRTSWLPAFWGERTLALALAASLPAVPAFAVGRVVGLGGAPVDATLANLTNVIAIASHTSPEWFSVWDQIPGLEGEHCAVLRSDGTVASWDSGVRGIVGITNVAMPTGLVNVIDITAGGGYRAALKADGTVQAWGVGLTGQTSVPEGLTNVVSISAGDFHCLALKADGTVVGWGDDGQGEIDIPAGLADVVAIAAGRLCSLALRADGTVVGWGDNSDRQIDLPPGLSNVIAIATAEGHSLALKDDGAVIAWGNYNRWGSVWDPGLGVMKFIIIETIPAVAPLTSNVVALAADLNNSLGLRTDGTVIGLGVGEATPLVGLSNIVAIAGGVLLAEDGPPVLHASIMNLTRHSSVFSCSVQSQSGKVYRLEYKDSPSDQQWTALPLVAGNGAAITLTDPGASGTQRFYRVRRW